MEKIKTVWLDQDGNMLFQENVEYYKIPQVGDNVYWSYNYMLVTGKTHDFDKNEIRLFVKNEK